MNVMTDKEIYEIWAPPGKKWVDWVRPVPFVEMHEISKKYCLSEPVLPVIDFEMTACKDAAIIVDLPEDNSVEMGLALAKKGYRPIPVFNGTIEQAGARSTVDNSSVGLALFAGAKMFSEIELAEEAKPAFLLDSNRLHRFKLEDGIFDNSWDIFHQDLPSAEYFLQNGIDKILVIGERVAPDLSRTLHGFQKKKIQIFLTKEHGTARKVKVHKPLFYKD